MTPNFCNHCGHRIYQHGSHGCEHVDIEIPRFRLDVQEVLPPGGHSTILPAEICNQIAALEKKINAQAPVVRTECECKAPHPLLVHGLRADVS